MSPSDTGKAPENNPRPKSMEEALETMTRKVIRNDEGGVMEEWTFFDSQGNLHVSYTICSPELAQVMEIEDILDPDNSIKRIEDES